MKTHKPMQFTSPQAAARMKEIAEFLSDGAISTSLEVACATGISRASANNYLAHMARNKLASAYTVEDDPQTMWGKYDPDAKPIGDGLPVVRHYPAASRKAVPENNLLFLLLRPPEQRL